ncbi:MAG: Tn3 family transposase [Deltaproteobacteria bacterium]|nr:Tn3 family transposase [Deltaproteobacteria bacterium]
MTTCFILHKGETSRVAVDVGDYEEIMNKASCLSLWSDAMPVWNTMAIMKIITELQAASETILDEDLTRISPSA